MCVRTQSRRMNIPSSDPVVLSRSRAVGLSPSQVPLAAHSPAGLPDRCAADPTHPPAQSAHRAGTPPARFPIPRPWHRARPTCARRHVRSTFNLSTCRCASFCTWATGPVHGSIGWDYFLGRQPFVGEITEKFCAAAEDAASRQGSSADGEARSWLARRCPGRSSSSTMEEDG